MTHQCPVTGCGINVPSHMFMCARHWRTVPKPLQAAVYESYRSTGRLSDNHFEAIRVVNGAEAGRSALGLEPGMKALTVYQPWASLVMIGAKPLEFRKWKFTDKPHLAKLVGRRIVVHASARAIRLSELTDLLERIEEGESALDATLAKPFIEMLRTSLASKSADASRIAPCAAALGTAILGEPRSCLDLFRDVIADSDRIDEHMYGWPMNDPQPFPEPIPANGVQGFWNWS